MFKLFDGGEDYPKIPEAKGAISAIRDEPFFLPLYALYLTYGGIFRLTFGPKVLTFRITYEIGSVPFRYILISLKNVSDA